MSVSVADLYYAHPVIWPELNAWMADLSVNLPSWLHACAHSAHALNSHNQSYS